MIPGLARSAACDLSGRTTGILLHPREVAPRAIDEEAGPRQHVVFARVDDELRRYPKCAQRLVHLLTSGNGHVEVLVTTEEQSGRADAIRVKEGVRDLRPQRRVAPGRPELGVVLHDVLVD